MENFDEYHFFAESTEKLSERRQNATQTYLAVNTAIFAILAFLVKDSGLRGWGLILLSLPLFLVGNLACVIWYKIILQYKVLIAWRYDQLIEFEKSKVLPNCMKIYMKEKEKFYSPTMGRESFGFSRLEKWLPKLFISLYGFYFIVILLGIIFRIL